MALQRRRRGYNAAVPSACFLLLLLLSAFLLLSTRRRSASSTTTGHGVDVEGTILAASSSGKEQGNCQELQSLTGGEARCSYLRTHTPCAPAGYVDYLRLFYCGFGRAPAVGPNIFAVTLSNPH